MQRTKLLLLLVALSAGVTASALADGVQPVVNTKEVLYGSSHRTITSNGDVTIDTTTHQLSALHGVKTNTLSFADGTSITSTNSITAASWGGIGGTLSSQLDLQARFVGVGVSTAALASRLSQVGTSTGTIQTQVTNLAVSTGITAAALSSLAASTTTLTNQTLSLAVSTTTLAGSITTLNTLLLSYFPVSLSTGVTGVLPIANLPATIPFTSSTNTWTGGNRWVLPSTFTAGLWMGGATIGSLQAAGTGTQFVVANATGVVSGVNLFGGTNVWSGFNSFSYPGGTSFFFGISVGSETIASVKNAVLATDSSGLVVSTIVPVSAGGTGITNPSLVAGTNVTSITGTWPNQTINVAAGVGSNSLAVTTGSVLGFSSVTSSPTAVINFLNTEFVSTLAGGATVFIQLNPGLVTMVGNVFNGANQLVQMTAGAQLPAVNANLLTNLNIANITGAPSQDILYASGGGITGSSAFNFNGTTVTYNQIVPLIVTNQTSTAVNKNPALIINNTVIGADYDVINFQFSGSTTPTQGAGWYFGVANFGAAGFSSPLFGLWNSAAGWVGGFDESQVDGSIGFEVGTSVGRNRFDVGGAAAIGTDLTRTGAHDCGVGGNQACGALAPPNGLAVQGTLVLGTNTVVAAGTQFEVVASTANRYAWYSSTSTVGGWGVDVSTSGHLNVTSVAGSTVTACGTAPSISGGDTAGTVTLGSGGVTSCTVTFANPFIAAPFCVVNTTSTATTASASGETAAGFTINVSASASAMTIKYVCIGKD